MLEQAGDHAIDADASSIAQRLVAARSSGAPLAAFPGRLPRDLRAAYACQDAAIELWPDRIAGWKVGLIGAEQAAILKQDRLAGPIFRSSVRRSEPGSSAAFPVFRGGFAAVEAEFLLLLGRDAPAAKTEWTLAEARNLVSAVHVGIETAGSPLATINELGPGAIVADFGNNFGLVVGPALTGWREKPVEQWRCETFIENSSVGRGHGAMPPGGPFESLRFLLGLSALRAKPLKAGDWISTGAITGVHEIEPGQHARVVFDGAGQVLCHAEPFAAAAAAVDGAP